ncbi:hypothetical protein [Dyadobacter sp. CY351]|nr:hypothetical protein [Dyadobacter sp. CY351]MCF2520169.1 hypothetical protein [Dyadobacter sp. CY351]
MEIPDIILVTPNMKRVKSRRDAILVAKIMAMQRQIPEGCDGLRDVASLRDFFIDYEHVGYRPAATNMASLRDLVYTR